MIILYRNTKKPLSALEIGLLLSAGIKVTAGKSRAIFYLDYPYQIKLVDALTRRSNRNFQTTIEPDDKTVTCL